MRNVMVKAWEIARKSAYNFGGKAIEYISGALRMAWAIIKKGENKMVDLIGSEKQIKWAEEIREKITKEYERFCDFLDNYAPNFFEIEYDDELTKEEFHIIMKELIENEVNSSTWISVRMWRRADEVAYDLKFTDKYEAILN